MKVAYCFWTFLILNLILVAPVIAQPGGGGPGTPTPIDGGIGILMAAAALYGYAKKQNP